VEDCLPAEEKRCCVELFSLYFNSYIWLAGGPFPVVFPALILYVLNIVFNLVVNSGDKNEHHFVFSTFIYRLAYLPDSNAPSPLGGGGALTFTIEYVLRFLQRARNWSLLFEK